MKIRKLSVYEDSSNRPYILLKGKRPEEMILQVFLFLYPACLIEHPSEVLVLIIPFN